MTQRLLTHKKNIGAFISGNLAGAENTRIIAESLNILSDDSSTLQSGRYKTVIASIFPDDTNSNRDDDDDDDNDDNKRNVSETNRQRHLEDKDKDAWLIFIKKKMRSGLLRSGLFEQRRNIHARNKLWVRR